MRRDRLRAIRGVALVTGGGAGIGASLCQQLGRAGIDVCIADLNGDAATRTATRIVDNGGQATAYPLDVQDREQFCDLVADIESSRGAVDLLVNNAGVGAGGEWQDHLPQDWRQVIGVNVFGVVHGVDAVYERMAARRRGTIVNVASLAGLFPLPGQAAYVASKYAVVGMTRVLRAEATAKGVFVSLVCPGVVDTAIYDSSPLRGFDKQSVLRLWPKGVSPERCADAILTGMRQGQHEIIVTPAARMLAGLERITPRLTPMLRTRYMQTVRKFRDA